MTFTTGLIIGIFIGASFGALIMAIVASGADITNES